MHTSITIDSLRVLDAIARKGSFAAAANALFRVPSAISYTVQRLEEDLSVTLFDRSKHRATLTPAGRYLLEQGRALLEAADHLAHTTRQIAQGWETRLKIVLNSLLPMTALLPAIRDFQALQLPVEIQVMEEVFAGAWDALCARRADLIFGADPMSRPAGEFVTHALGDIEFVYAVAPGHPLAKQSSPISETDASVWPAVVAADSSRQLSPGNVGIFARQHTLTVSTIEQKIEAQCAGLGVGWLPEPRVRTQLRQGQLIALKTTFTRSPITLSLVHHRGDQGKALFWFADRLRQADCCQPWLRPVTNT